MINKILKNTHPLKLVSEKSNKGGTSLFHCAPARDSEPCWTAVLHLISAESKVPGHSQPVAATQAPPARARPRHGEALPGDTDPSSLRSSFKSGSSWASGGGGGPDAPSLQLALQPLGRGPCCALSPESAGRMSGLSDEHKRCELADKPPDAGAAATEPAAARMEMPAQKARAPASRPQRQPTAADGAWVRLATSVNTIKTAFLLGLYLCLGLSFYLDRDVCSGYKAQEGAGH